MLKRSTFVLLLLLVIGVWGLLLRPIFTPEPVHAQGGGSVDRQLIYSPNGLYLAGPGANLFHFGFDLTLNDIATSTVRDAQGPKPYIDYVTVHK